jgi:hypothetical protein
MQLQWGVTVSRNDEDRHVSNNALPTHIRRV